MDVMVANASNIMTEELTCFGQEDRVRSVVETMEEESFDVAPIKISGYIRKFVEKADLADASPTNQVVQHGKEIQEHNLLGPEIPVVAPSPDSRDLLSILDERDNNFVFIVDDGIAGIVTRADFNKIRAGLPFYHLISEYEAGICDLIDDVVEHDRWLSVFDNETQGDIEGLYDDVKKENVDLRLVDCLNTRQIHEVVMEYGLWTELGFSSEEKAEEVLEEIIELRNDVMHQRPIVGEQSFDGFVETISEIKETNATLQKQR